MEADPQPQHFICDHYEIQLVVVAPKKLTVTLLDTDTSEEYHAEGVELKQIGCNTVCRALSVQKEPILPTFRKKHGENEGIEVVISVESPFLKTVEESFFLPKVREVGVVEIAKKAVDRLSSKVRELSQHKHKLPISYYGGHLERKSYNGQNYEPLATVKLPKGRYLLTFSFLLNCQNQWIYLYLNQGQQVIQNCGWYMPASGVWTPYTVCKQHTVGSVEEEVSFTTYYANSYRIVVQNAIITAKRLPDE